MTDRTQFSAAEIDRLDRAIMAVIARKKNRRKGIQAMHRKSANSLKTKTYITVYECDCGWRCGRRNGKYESLIVCPVCDEPKMMMAVMGYSP